MPHIITRKKSQCLRGFQLPIKEEKKKKEKNEE